MRFLIVIVVSTMLYIVSGYFKSYKIQKVNKTAVREFQMRNRSNDTKLKDAQHYLPKRGNFTNCGQSSDHFSFQWSPFVIDIQDKCTIYMDFVAPVSYKNGKADVKVYVHDQPNSPMVKMDLIGTCATFAETVHLKCPIAAKDEIKNQITIPYIMGVPTGKYILVVNITNENKDIFGCARAEVEFVMHSKETKEQRTDMTEW